MVAHCSPTPDIDLHALSQRLRTKSALLLDADPDFCAVLYLAACIVSDLQVTRIAVDLVLAEAVAGVGAMGEITELALRR
jgi:hypothetical protein